MERKEKSLVLESIGKLIKKKREALGDTCKTREGFLNYTSEFMDNVEWISLRYLSSIEEGKNMLSIFKLIDLSNALQMEPIELFEEIVYIIQNSNCK